MTPDLKQRIETLLAEHETVLFMKGVPEAPMCGFSARAVQIMQFTGAPFTGVNILEDQNLREGLKEYGDWPTFPQLYHKGELLGGCDIMTEMYQTGELHDALGVEINAA